MARSGEDPKRADAPTPRGSRQVSVRFPAHFDADAELIEAKGYFDGLTFVLPNGRRATPVVYDQVRLAQEVADALRTGPAFIERPIIVVSSVTRENIERAAQRFVAEFLTSD